MAPSVCSRWAAVLARAAARVAIANAPPAIHWSPRAPVKLGDVKPGDHEAVQPEADEEWHERRADQPGRVSRERDCGRERGERFRRDRDHQRRAGDTCSQVSDYFRDQYEPQRERERQQYDRCPDWADRSQAGRKHGGSSHCTQRGGRSHAAHRQDGVAREEDRGHQAEGDPLEGRDSEQEVSERRLTVERQRQRHDTGGHHHCAGGGRDPLECVVERAHGSDHLSTLRSIGTGQSAVRLGGLGR